MATTNIDIGERRERAFRQARAHSQLVRILRKALPLVALSGFGLLLISGAGLFSTSTPSIDVSGIGLESGEVAMDNPRVQGTSAGGQVYDIQADTAYQDISSPQRVRFIGVTGTVTDPGQPPTRISADEGVFMGEEERIILTGNVVVIRPDGERMQAQETEIDLASGSMVADGTIEMRTDNGQMQASRMLLNDEGDKVEFEGPVKVILHYREADHQRQMESAQ